MNTTSTLFDGSNTHLLGPEVTGWSVTGRGHVVPNCDLRDHIEDAECWCSPTEDGGAMIHHSADGRELFEYGERKAS